jgi:hypothetical protein
MELIIAGGIIYWCVVALIVTIVSIGTVTEDGRLVFWPIILGCASLWFFTGFQPIDWHWVGNHWLAIALGVVAYVAVGPVWAFANWCWFFIPDRYDEYSAMKDTYQATYKDRVSSFTRNEQQRKDKNPEYVIQPYPEDYKTWLFGDQDFPPTLGHNKGKIMIWMLYWPVSAFWTLSHKPLIRIYRYVIEHMSTIFTAYSRNYFTSRSDELK